MATVHEHLKALQEKGYLNKHRGQARGMSPRIHIDKLVYIPLLGTVAAGEPIEVIENRETIAIPKAGSQNFQKYTLFEYKEIV